MECGYWEPVEGRPGMIWVPGWFDGTRYIPGNWIPQAEYDAVDPAAWQPDPGWNEGWAEPEHAGDTEEPPLALPVSVE
jgi:hypothetical protein